MDSIFLPRRFDRPGCRVVAKLECFRADAKAPPTKPHGLDIRSRFVYHTWDGKDLKLLPAKLRRRLPFGAAQGRTTSAERRQPTCRRQRRTPLPDDLRQRRLHERNTQEALTRIVFSWANGRPVGRFPGPTGVSPVGGATLGRRASRPFGMPHWDNGRLARWCVASASPGTRQLSSCDGQDAPVGPRFSYRESQKSLQGTSHFPTGDAACPYRGRVSPRQG